MIRIIADTNVWYNITKDQITDLYRNGFRLVIPIIVLNELHTSPNLYSVEKFCALKGAVKTILDSKDYIEFENLNPFEYLIKNNRNTDCQDHTLFYLKEFESLINLEFEDVINLPRLRPDISGLTEFINLTSVNYRKIINKSKNNKIEFEKFETTILSQNLLINWFNDIFDELNYPRISNISNHLLLAVFDEMLRRSSKQGNKFEDNDWVDIFLLVYVENKDLLWTNEVSKLNIIKYRGFEKFLFNIGY